jgi:hypothetical protein
MKVITSIYLNCRPDLRDEWLTGTEVDDVSDAQVRLVDFAYMKCALTWVDFTGPRASTSPSREVLCVTLRASQVPVLTCRTDNNKRYGSVALQQAPAHRRTASISQHFEGLLPGPDMPLVRPIGTPNVVEADVFPPLRAQAQDPSSNFLPFIAEDIAFEEEYEEYLSDLNGGDHSWADGNHSAAGSSAWSRLPELAADLVDGISDSESVVSIGELGDDARLDAAAEGEPSADANVNNWEVRMFVVGERLDTEMSFQAMSPKTMAALPKSPAGPRRSSQGGNLRPVIPLDLDDADGSAVEDDVEEELPEPGPMPRSPGTFATPGGGVDEVEYAYGSVLPLSYALILAHRLISIEYERVDGGYLHDYSMSRFCCSLHPFILWFLRSTPFVLRLLYLLARIF